MGFFFAAAGFFATVFLTGALVFATGFAFPLAFACAFSRRFWRAALFLLMTPFLTALSSAL